MLSAVNAEVPPLWNEPENSTHTVNDDDQSLALLCRQSSASTEEICHRLLKRRDIWRRWSELNTKLGLKKLENFTRPFLTFEDPRSNFIKAIMKHPNSISLFAENPEDLEDVLFLLPLQVYACYIFSHGLDRELLRWLDSQ